MQIPQAVHTAFARNLDKVEQGSLTAAAHRRQFVDEVKLMPGFSNPYAILTIWVRLAYRRAPVDSRLREILLPVRSEMA